MVVRYLEDPEQTRLFDVFAGILSPTAYQKLRKGWQSGGESALTVLVRDVPIPFFEIRSGIRLDSLSYMIQNECRRMTMTIRQSLYEKLETRRRELGLSQSVLSERSGVSLPTVQRILSGHGRAASFENTLAIAQVLGMQFDAVTVIPAKELLRQQALKKAERLVRMVQGTSALEAQGVSAQHLGQMIKKTVHELLAGSRRRLWAE